VKTLRDVAKVAGVSIATASRVLNNHEYVSEKTRNKVLSAVEDLGYRPSRLAVGLRTGRTRIFGLIISDIGNPYFASVVRGIEDIAYANGYNLILCNSDEDPEKEELYINVFLDSAVSGAIIACAREDSMCGGKLLDAGIPIVAMDRRMMNFNVDTVITNNVKGAYEAVIHLIEQGHRKIGFIGGPLHTTTGRERWEGYKKALSEHGYELNQDLIKLGNFKQRSGQEAASELLEKDDRPTALFAANNFMTLGALNSIHDKGLKIPDEIAIVGFDDLPWAQSLDPPLTAVEQSANELGKTAADLLIKRIDDPNRPITTVTLNTNLVVRKSSRVEPTR
jgi:DNA-binding LacI/PurR family transcriptional regulator